MMSEGADWLHMGKSPCVLLDFGRDSGSLLLVEISDVMDGYVVSYPYLSSLPTTKLTVFFSHLSPAFCFSFFSHFVPNITMGFPVLEMVKKNVPNIFMDCHMMVSDPAKVGKKGLWNEVSKTKH